MLSLQILSTPTHHSHPISFITGLQTALDNKESIFTKNTAFNKNFGTTSGTVAQGNDSRILNGQTAFGWGNHSSAGYALNSALTAHINKVDNPHAVTKAQVGLGNVDNTSDANKPISNAVQTALNLKANLASPTFTGNVTAPKFIGGISTNNGIEYLNTLSANINTQGWYRVFVYFY